MNLPLIPAAELELHPHRIFKTHRPVTPVIRREDGVHVAIRAADVDYLATDPRTRQMQTEIGLVRGVTQGPLFDFFNNTMLLSNGVAHRRRRAPLSRAFALKVVNDLRPHIRRIVNDLIDKHYARGEMRFRDDLASWIPARVVSDMLGISAADIPEFTRNVYQLARSLSPSFRREDVPELNEAADWLTRYVEALLERRRHEPRDDLLTSYLRAVDEADVLSRIEALMQIVSVILAGSDTTRAALTIQLSLLMQHRDQWEALRRDPSLLHGAVLESLRYEPSVGSYPRFTLEDIEIDGCTVPRNVVLSMSTLSAMRDPALYRDPDRFDISRTDHPKKPLVFGAGSHRCLGETLALLELEETLAALAERLPNIEILGDIPIVMGSGGIRQVSEMVVRW
jgi:cytochrome P450 family 103